MNADAMTDVRLAADVEAHYAPLFDADADELAEAERHLRATELQVARLAVLWGHLRPLLVLIDPRALALADRFEEQFEGVTVGDFAAACAALGLPEAA